MRPRFQTSGLLPGLVERHGVAAYFALTFSISWTGALAVAAPHLLRHETLPKLTGILMFPAMLLGPCLAGIFLTWLTDGREGLRDLRSRMSPSRVPARWIATVLIPPVLVLCVLAPLAAFVSPDYGPNFFPIGILFGVPAGFLEEIGWMGYAFPRMRSRNGDLRAGILLGLLWALWHLPVIDFLGSASPHGAFLLPFFLAFALAMTAMRVLIARVYARTNSVLIAQLLHVSSTGSLVVFGAWRTSPAQEATWYALYGIVLWLVVSIATKATDK